MVALREVHGEAHAATAAMVVPDRRYELDWLRPFVVLCVISYHVMGIFAAGTTLYLHDAGSGLQLDVPSAFVNAWAIPLLFAISGASAMFSLRQRSAWAYVRSRASRLLVPFLFGTLLLVPLQVYGVLLTNPSLLSASPIPVTDPHLLDSYPRFYAQYLLAYAYFLGHYSPQLEFIFWGHLWFIARLIACSVVTLPLLLLLRTALGKRMIGVAARAAQWPLALLLPGLLLGGAIAVLREPWARLPFGAWSTLDWAQMTVLVLCYLIGYALYADYRVVRALQGAWPLALPLGIVLFAVCVTVDWSALPEVLGMPLRRVTEGMVDWLWVLVFLSLAARYLARSSRALPYLNEGTYSFYVLHMPVLVGVAILVLPLAVPLAAKAALLLAGTLLATLALYLLVVRPFSVTRFLLGVRLAYGRRHGDGSERLSPGLSADG